MFQNQIIPATTIPADTQVLDLFRAPEVWCDGEASAWTIHADEPDAHGGRKDFLNTRVQMVSITKDFITNRDILHARMLPNLH